MEYAFVEVRVCRCHVLVKEVYIASMSRWGVGAGVLLDTRGDFDQGHDVDGNGRPKVAPPPGSQEVGMVTTGQFNVEVVDCQIPSSSAMQLIRMDGTAG